MWFCLPTGRDNQPKTNAYAPLPGKSYVLNRFLISLNRRLRNQAGKHGNLYQIGFVCWFITCHVTFYVSYICLYYRLLLTSEKPLGLKILMQSLERPNWSWQFACATLGDPLNILFHKESYSEGKNQEIQVFVPDMVKTSLNASVKGLVITGLYILTWYSEQWLSLGLGYSLFSWHNSNIGVKTESCRESGLKVCAWCWWCVD